MSPRRGAILPRMALAGALTGIGSVVSTMGVRSRRPIVALIGAAMVAYGALGIEVYR
jgi:hypothetical protein